MDATDTPSPIPAGPLAVDLAVAGLSGALTLVDPARLGMAGRLAFRTSQAAVVAALAWVTTRDVPELEWQPEKRAAMVAGAVAVTCAFAEVGEAIDAAAVRGLARRGVRRPRLVAAAGSVALALGLTVLDRRTRSLGAPEEADDAVDVVERPLPERVREIIAAILERTEDHDSLRLRAQLRVASEQVWEADEFSRLVELSVPDDVPLAVPRTFTFPVSARFRTRRGVPCIIELLVAQGHIASLLIDVDPDEWDEIADEWDDAGGDPDPLADIGEWPLLEELTFVTETAGRP